METLRRCVSCKEEKPVSQFNKDTYGMRCRECRNRSIRKYHANKRHRENMYHVRQPHGFPDFWYILGKNMEYLENALYLFSRLELTGAVEVVVPVDRYPETGYPSTEHLRVIPTTAPRTAPYWRIRIDDQRLNENFTTRPIHVMAAWLTKRFVVLKPPYAVRGTTRYRLEPVPGKKYEKKLVSEPINGGDLGDGAKPEPVEKKRS